MVARPLWERKVVGSNPATPTSRYAARATESGHKRPFKIALWAPSSLRLLCKLRARMSLYRARSAGPGNDRTPADLRQNPRSQPKETEP